MADVKVGDEVRVYLNRRGGGSDPGEVVRVGRKLVTIRVNGREYQFHLDDQRWSGRQVGRGTYFQTLEQVAAREHETSVRATLSDHGIELSRRHRFTLEQMEALAAVAETFGQGGLGHG